MHNRSRLHVGDLPPGITEAALRALFEQADDVESVTISDVQNRTTPYAFVVMKTNEGARKAIERFNGYNLDGHRLFVYSIPPRSLPKGERKL